MVLMPSLYNLIIGIEQWLISNNITEREGEREREESKSKRFGCS
jgi:hypothetical protein